MNACLALCLDCSFLKVISALALSRILFYSFYTIPFDTGVMSSLRLIDYLAGSPNVQLLVSHALNSDISV